MNQLADALSAGGSSYASDEDLELVKQATPFSLKLMESVLEENPHHAALLEAAAGGFTQYAYAFVQQEADEQESTDYAKAEKSRMRAKKLYVRAHRYALRALEVQHPGFERALAAGVGEVRAITRKEDAGLLYWAAASLGGAVALGKDDTSLMAEIPNVESLIDAALAADESWGSGAIHAFLITYEPNRQGAAGDPFVRARQHFERSVALSQGHAASPYVAYAEAVCVQKQDLAGFEEALAKALAIDPDARLAQRLETLVLQRRARWLLGRKSDLFLSTSK